MVKNLLAMKADDIDSSLKDGSITVCVVGIGRIGLPTALSFAKAGLTIVGLDINEKLVEMIRNRDFPLKDEPGYQEIFDDVINSGKFRATTSPDEAISNSDIVILSLPTPMDGDNVPDYAALRSVAGQLNRLLSAGSIVIVESTIEPGFAEDEMVSLIEGDRSRLRASENFGFGVCPESANPGTILSDFEKMPRLVGGLDDKSADIVARIYRHVFSAEQVPMSDCKTANAVKLTTNVFRDINIAFVNELAMLFERMGIDIIEVIEAAKKKHNFQPHYPGAGVGGPCLPVNSYQFLSTASKFDNGILRLVKAGREINEHMPSHTVRLLSDGLSEIGRSIDNSTVLILGASYKPNIKDVQLSPAKYLVDILRSSGSKIKIYDPYFKDQILFGIKTESELADALRDTDAVVLATAHDEFLDLDPNFVKNTNNKRIFVDSQGVMDIHAAKKAGLIYRGTGRGNTA